jgi:hypothetical protein
MEGEQKLLFGRIPLDCSATSMLHLSDAWRHYPRHAASEPEATRCEASCLTCPSGVRRWSYSW